MPARILILDEHVTRRITLAARLSGDFYDIQVAASPGEALALARHWHPQVVMLAEDLRLMPSGRFIQSLRADPLLSEVTIFVITAPGAQVGRTGLLAAGADEILSRAEPEEVFRARLRAHDRARDTLETLKFRGGPQDPPGLAEPALQFTGLGRIVALPPDAETGRSWQNRLGRMPGLKLELAWQLPPGLCPGQDSPAEAPPRCGLFLLSARADAEQASLRRLAALESWRDRLDSEVLLLAPGCSVRLRARAYDLGASAVMDGPFDAEEIAARLRRLHGRLMQRRQLHAELSEGMRASVTDPLTGLSNRRFALPRLARAAREAAQEARPFAVLLPDIDHFKAVNDRHGHAAGDRTLQSVARILKDSLRAEDVVARIGGEEFLILLPDTGPEAARHVADRLCASVRDRMRAQGLPAPDQAVTISVGLTFGLAGRRDPAQLLADADAALYRAKHAGRDQVALHPGPESGPGKVIPFSN
ncbi:diguanylate cyclase [Pseudooceanicola sp. CBS1P-1]|uniref:diguanylate cyclase n=1 Tax=Pseudooceanicola albus TaxID=2692189 RepID=A0A6L7FY66_9RHOB|nr:MULTISPECIES: diguanylate cyclase [Pseudooceanicola]MBT9383448.1 diguanylate cyclase [Pseudooceanicola endophyticus]MXN16230.1 diguanylate cyclase [Pseudooceanicola albus]